MGENPAAKNPTISAGARVRLIVEPTTIRTPTQTISGPTLLKWLRELPTTISQPKGYVPRETNGGLLYTICPKTRIVYVHYHNPGVSRVTLPSPTPMPQTLYELLKL